MKGLIGSILALGLVAAAYAAETPENLIPNWGFEDGVVAPWTAYGQAVLSMADKQDAFAGSEALKIEVAAAGVNFWDSGVQYKGAGENIFFEGGVQYTWAFFMKADPPVRINIKPELAVDPWTGYGEKQVDVTDEYQEFWTTWQTPADVVPASLTLHVAFNAATLWMDEVRWYEGEYIPYEEWGQEQPQAVDPAGKLATTWAQLKR
ncbi:MAG: hypothetical protein KatS3mg115_1121 [Candidatus Poribacteria bacterium]|nr:MAG: hypothetical protein KatS3mg115_1121 [Candidatus Poribacteria bacterium]